VNLTIGFQSDKGLRRNKNEDSYAVLNRTQLSGKLDGLLVVADGMGGLRGGEVASRTVVETIPQVVIETLAQRNGSGTPLDVGTLLRDAIIRANGIIWRMRRFDKSPDTRGMGTTCVAAIIQNETLTLANVGDSRAYLLRDGKLTQLTKDHSEVFEQVQAGMLTPAEANNSRFRNIVTRGVGLGQEVLPDITTHALQEGDTLLLCSDGLTTEVEDAQIEALLSREGEAQEVCTRLVSAALRHGGRDNVTIITMRYGTFVPTSQALPDWDEEEPDTDPDQEWRTRPLHDDEDEDEDEIPPFPSRPIPSRHRTPLFSGMAQLVIMLLALLCAVEGVALFYALKGSRHVPVPTPTPQAPPVSPALDLNYGPVMPLDSQRTFQDEFLQVDPQGNALVVTLQGNLMKISPSGQETLLPGNVPSLPDTSPASKPNKAPAAKPAARPDLALDANGTLYYLDREAKCILIYNAKGTRINDRLGKGDLTAPTRIAVDNRTGSLYILDTHQLKRIAATPPDNSKP